MRISRTISYFIFLLTLKYEYAMFHTMRNLALKTILSFLTGEYRKPKKAIRIRLRFGRPHKKHHHDHYNNFFKEAIMANPFNLPCTMEVPFVATFLDVMGNAVPVASVKVISENETLIRATLDTALDVSASTVRGTVTAVGPLGTSNIVISGVNKNGSVVTLTQPVTIVGGNATEIRIEFGTPTAKK